jgi:hypothetical protein
MGNSIEIPAKLFQQLEANALKGGACLSDYVIEMLVRSLPLQKEISPPLGNAE